MRNLRGRAKLRGEPLHEFCHRARTENWLGATVCGGMISEQFDELLPECKCCKALAGYLDRQEVLNILEFKKQMKEVRNEKTR